MRSLVLLLLITCLPLAASAEVIEIEGMHFECDACAVERQEPCEVRLVLEHPVLLSCDEALVTLLREAIKAGASGETPSLSEVRRFLLEGKPSESTSVLALQFLSKTQTGERSLIQDGPLYLEKYESAFRVLFAHDEVSDSLRMAYWKMPSREGVPLSPELQAVIAAKHEKLGLRELLEQSESENIEQMLTHLRRVEKALENSDPELYEELKKAEGLLARCVRIFENTTPVPECRDETLAEQHPTVADFIQRAQVRELNRVGRNESLTPASLIQLVGKVDVKKHRTPDLHVLVKQAIDKALEGSSAQRKGFNQPEIFDTISVFAANDTEIASRAGILFTVLAEAEAENQRPRAAIDLLEKSVEFVPKSFERRDILFAKLSAETSWQNDSELVDRFNQIRSGNIEAGTVWGMRSSTRLALFAITAGLALIWILGAYMYRSRVKVEEEEQEEAELNALQEVQELAALRRFFGVRADDSNETLSKSYRRLAREAHPDTGAGDEEAIRALNEKYQRIRELISVYGKMTPEEAESDE